MRPPRFPLRVLLLLVILVLSPSPRAQSARGPGTLDDLKNLEIICFVPGWLPKGFEVKRVQVTYDEPGPNEGGGKFPLYNIEYRNDRTRSFTIDSAREGIGDRNIMETENSEETELHSALFGPVYIIYTPKGKTGVKKEIIANWVEDANMQRETGTDHLPHPILGRFHGFSAAGISVAEFAKIIGSLQPIRPAQDDATGTAATSIEKTGGTQVDASARAAPPKLHPKIFNMIESWISDGESPVVTEINLDAVAKDTNEFDPDAVKQEDGWTRCPGAEPNSFMRYRLLESNGNRYKAEYQENGGGSLTTASIIDFTIEKRDIERDGHPAPITVLRVSSSRLK